jgi:pantoate--beta-alanine ligase
VDAQLRAGADSIDYATLAEVDTVRPIDGERTPDQALLAVAVRLGGARLIDNVVLGEEPSPLRGASLAAGSSRPPPGSPAPTTDAAANPSDARGPS